MTIEDIKANIKAGDTIQFPNRLQATVKSIDLNSGMITLQMEASTRAGAASDAGVSVDHLSRAVELVRSESEIRVVEVKPSQPTTIICSWAEILSATKI